MVKFGSIEIVDDNNWNLNEALPKTDWEAMEVDMKITSDFGMGVKTIYENEEYTYKRNPRKYPTVTLIITTWKGISGDAIHFYGKFEVDLPEMEKNSCPGYTVGVGGYGAIPMYSNSTIELTQVLEQWEIDKYPQRFEYFHAGDRVTGFYTPDGVIRRAKEVFEKIFDDGWKMKIERRF